MEIDLTADLNHTPASAEVAPSQWGPFAHAAFTIILIANTVSNMGLAMFDTGSRWLMINLNADPMAVSAVHIATTLPMFLLTLPAGALADIFDPRRLLIAVQIGLTILSAIFAMLVSLDLVTPSILLTATFLLAAGGTVGAPAWLSLAPLLVPRRDLDGAVAAGSASYNASRAVGPLLGGVVIGGLGIAAPFWAFSLGSLVFTVALIWWRSPRKGAESLPAERLISAIRTGIRYAANNQHLHATMIRAVAFFPFASAYLTLLPFVARGQPHHGPVLYGALLGAIGVGAILGSFALNSLKAQIGPDRVAALGTLGAALALVLFAFAHDLAISFGACVIAGACWTLVLTSLYVSAQVALPDWVRGRGLAIFLTVYFGAMTLGSAIWGKIAEMEGLPAAFLVASAGAVLAIPLTWHWKLQTAAGLDLSPSMHGRAPVLAEKVEQDEGPVLVTIEYRIDAKDRAAFVGALDELGHERKRDGAYAWGVFEDAADDGRFLETFLIESWLELEHLHERVTNADRMLEDQIHRLLADEPRITHLVASERSRRSHRTGALQPLQASSA